MKTFVLLPMAVTILATAIVAAEPQPREEAAILARLKAKGTRITTDDKGHALKLMSSGGLSLEELQSIGKLRHLEQLALNAPPGGDEDWEFLRGLPKLKTLTIWHGHHFRSLKPLSGLKVEALTLGGCMGLRNLNRETPEGYRDAVLTLRELPNLKRLTVYHSPLTPGDQHLAHIVAEFPKLTELRIDFAAPRNSDTSLTPRGLERLAKLPLKKLAIENAHQFSPAHVEALAKISTLENIHVHPRNSTVEHYRELLAPLAEARPQIEITFQAPPRPAPKPKRGAGT